MDETFLGKKGKQERGWERDLPGKLKYALSFFFLLSAIAGAGAGGVYSDKNGYFTFVPPAGWVMADRSRDGRTKAEFRSPDGVASIGIVARPEEGNYLEILEEKKDYVAKRKLRFPQGKFAYSEVIICRAQAVKVGYEMPPVVKEEQYFFLAGGLQFNLSYGVVDPEDFFKYRQVALDAFATLEARQAPIQAKEENVTR
jgi:hypothetical protein